MVVRPATRRLRVRGRTFTLRAMSGETLLDWVEMQVLAAREKAQALWSLRSADEDSLRECLRRLYSASDVLVRRALGAEDGFIAELTEAEKAQIVQVQDELNQMEMLALGAQFTALGAPHGQSS